MRNSIANVKAGSFKAWFDFEDDAYQIFWYEDNQPSSHTFQDEKSAKSFWHKNVIERFAFQHCYCCK